MTTLKPINNAKLKLAYKVADNATSFYTVGKITKDSTGSGIIGKQIATLTPNGTNQERAYCDVSVEPTLHLDRSALGLENIYRYDVIRWGIDNDNEVIPPTLYSATARKEHNADDDVYFGISAEFFYELAAIVESTINDKAVELVCFGYTVDIATGDGRAYFKVPAKYNNHNLTRVSASIITAGVTGTTSIQVHNLTDGVDMLSTPMTIDTTKTSTETSATPAVIDTTKDDVVTNDILRIDVDSIQSGTAPKGGPLVVLEFTPQ